MRELNNVRNEELVLKTLQVYMNLFPVKDAYFISKSREAIEQVSRAIQKNYTSKTVQILRFHTCKLKNGINVDSRFGSKIKNIKRTEKCLGIDYTMFKRYSFTSLFKLYFHYNTVANSVKEIVNLINTTKNLLNVLS